MEKRQGPDNDWEATLRRVRSREVRALLQAVRRHERRTGEGWRIDSGRSRGGHPMLYPPPDAPDARIVAIPTTPSEHRGLKNLRSALVRAGVPKEALR